ncbi:hypothetical protein IQ07DRAFT_645014 [Pyrenochaeta sp. DS3sAY3a]|nr:hypothetical protein IQ07DRAFT_645014 [Pyrenochaeta sp. DS3sAY3a]
MRDQHPSPPIPPPPSRQLFNLTTDTPTILDTPRPQSLPPPPTPQLFNMNTHAPTLDLTLNRQSKPILSNTHFTHLLHETLADLRALNASNNAPTLPAVQALLRRKITHLQRNFASEIAETKQHILQHPLLPHDVAAGLPGIAPTEQLGYDTFIVELLERMDELWVRRNRARVEREREEREESPTPLPGRLGRGGGRGAGEAARRAVRRKRREGLRDRDRGSARSQSLRRSERISRRQDAGSK